MIQDADEPPVALPAHQAVHALAGEGGLLEGRGPGGESQQCGAGHGRRGVRQQVGGQVLGDLERRAARSKPM